jgi:hypothetical protein
MPRSSSAFGSTQRLDDAITVDIAGYDSIYLVLFREAVIRTNTSRRLFLMADGDKCNGPGVLVLLSFLVGTAVGVGLVLLAERRLQDDTEAGYGEGPLFV